MAELVLRFRDRELHRVPVIAMRTTLGRDPSCDLMIDNAGVSRTHALVLFDDGQYSVHDEESQNGISVNGQRVKEASLKYGDVIGIGKFEIDFVASGHFPLATGEAPKAGTAHDGRRTMQMDTALAVRIHKEALTAAQKAKGPKAPAPPPARRASALSTFGLVVVGLVAVALLGGAAWLLLSR